MLDFTEKKFIGDFFNESGYVLDFSDASFDEFTMDSIGIPLKTKYGLSKARSLIAFVKEASDSEILKLLKDLLSHIEFTNYNLNEKQKKLYPKLREIVARDYSGFNLSTSLVTQVNNQFSDAYIENQLRMMESLMLISTADVIGKSKELVESCFKHILDDLNEEYTQKDSISTVRKKVFVKLNLDAKTNQAAKSNDDVKKILNSFNSIIDGISTLRNDKGDGHGKGRSFQELPIRYAELAMNASLTVVQFTWSTYQELNKIQK